MTLRSAGGKDRGHREQKEQSCVDMKLTGMFREEYIEKLARSWANRYVDAWLWENCKPSD